MTTKKYTFTEEDYAAVRDGMTVKEIRAKWGCGKGVALRIRREAKVGNLQGEVPQHKWVSPEQLHEMARTMTQEDAAAHSGVSLPTYRKLEREAGVIRNPINRFVSQPLGGKPREPIPDAGRHPLAEQSFEYLQRHHGAIWHCTHDGHFSLTGRFFRFRNQTFDAAGIVAKADALRTVAQLQQNKGNRA